MSVRRTIWALWLQGADNAPPLVRSCLDSWKAMNTGWDFKVLQKRDLGDYVDLDAITGGSANRMKPQHLSDILRINLLAVYGGVWVDATCLCMVPLDDWIDDRTKSGFFAFSRPGPDRLISSWFLASQAGCPLTEDYARIVNAYCAANDSWRHKGRISWRLESAIRSLIGKDPWRSALYATPAFARYIRYTPYYWFHYAFAYLLLRSRHARKIWAATPKISADGPHAIQHHGMFEPASDAITSRVRGRIDPVYKLNWKLRPDGDASGSAVECALREIGVWSGL